MEWINLSLCFNIRPIELNSKDGTQGGRDLAGGGQQMIIQYGDQHLTGLLRSGVHLASFTHALKTLLEISIRSVTNAISSPIDPATKACTICVDDNGIGIDQDRTS
ncbi:uncharacterized protein PGTG_15199 [Puccinia graminis f. sp. tritici CRL 75-36-700-3]|uniref:Uncharacterized protein n=1 Tax=Puccinia graminis f. sp. tritici (strain CRL 75-36-700-3 / race SCCL) TaxID=418459 RepID=E3KXC3_PUCGT|nr:uncharacterized protein PGTG_15199 [Puccinia graminis f. sp. tritici CRL 75-36-700-3]EFP88996.1 hypothetical protein PGTG_15199 [Puccinia graminis f. sp. tritici CRL 75-36-700-3]